METKKELVNYLKSLDSMDLIDIMGWISLRIQILEEAEKEVKQKEEC